MCPVGVGDRLRFANPNDLAAVANDNRSNHDTDTPPNDDSGTTANHNGYPDNRAHNNATSNYDSASLR